MEAGNDLARRVDELVAEGRLDSRSDGVRRGLELLIDAERRARTGAAIVDGYRRLPQSPDEIGSADEATRAMIADEPW